MKSLHWFLHLLIIAFTVLRSVEAQNQAGFISLDCGLVPKETTYTEKSTNITYKSDVDYIDSGLVGKINDAYKTQFQQQVWAVRSFPVGQRNCYNVNLTANNKYLIRGTFVYGNYDGLNQFPSFDLHIGPNKWSSVKILGVTNTSMHEIIHVVPQDSLEVCLVKTGPTTPFISSLEVRPLNNESYLTQSGSLMLFARVYFPSSSSSFIRYDEDIHDRVWNSFTDDETVWISTDLPIDTSNSYDMPQSVMKTAAVPKNASEPWLLWWTLDENTAQSYVYMHFAEVQNLTANETREFNITYNGGLRWFSYLRPPNLSISTIFNPRAVSSSNGIFNFTFAMTGNSTLPPLLNALEIYTVVDILQLETNKDEVSAMMNIKETYGLSKKISWQGDPCAPQLYRWEGLNCSYPDSEGSRIISLNLNGSELTGSITSDISKLTLLTVLDLSNNDLSGDIPTFFAEMKSLKLINLSGNPNLNLTAIPDSLQQRVNSKSLTLILGENLTLTPKKESKKVPMVAIAASVAGVFALLVILAIFFVIKRKNVKAHKSPGPPPLVTPGIVKSETRSSNPSIITRERKITYPEVLKMTNNFERVLGKGGFGTVYHGNLDGAEVAVKMLSHSSAQGYKEFKAEVELLLRVHHRHLVGLVGYCDDGDNLALIYEYMANGDLRENMSGKRGGNVLTWENRMQIAVEAAQGLEYLHNGCRPPMVHRDVKTTNILLNERCGAKLADFGLSRSFPIDGECHVSTVVAGTPGYLDPEYYRTNWLSEKSDVYSFGVVLLEIVTNQPVIDKTRERPHINDWVGFMLTKGDIKSIVDPKLMGDYDTNGAWKIVELALACVNPSSNRRPTMAHVVMELNDCVALENARRQGSEEMYSMGSVDYSLSSTSDFAPGAR
ncbi:Leucine-rich repeat protein kinase family protein [Arabidopsis thaliana]|uniref:Probable LRR receptor-like serine/threonine-protein kinase At1g51860 n=2 Tax=Arabidopsis thaliana TaxID=3702 RepID=Y1518_ARATH|nr:Leucine-rich repeat protein kinase family protein [Arabidopsis thaliana]C0LGG4.2 RecName: Full=Probable LRR receptor-like serine/threonine-protein kinase At1g51860; Flags: Precursor [Arabidopsis thaliana]AEE32726.1 Leucine-rich repeat protein kinase family protein [Arabidopsis thaliana]|eukprot:NP_175598.1 Leucine-rich repeat protein kinase family protein [Arabidopsis thaliana]